MDAALKVKSAAPRAPILGGPPEIVRATPAPAGASVGERQLVVVPARFVLVDDLRPLNMRARTQKRRLGQCPAAAGGPVPVLSATLSGLLRASACFCKRNETTCRKSAGTALPGRAYDRAVPVNSWMESGSVEAGD